METANVNTLKSTRLKFIGLYIAAIILLGIIMAAFWGPLPAVPRKAAFQTTGNKSAEDEEVLNADKLLHSQLLDLYEADKRSVTDSGSSVNKAEEDLQKSIDSLDQVKTNLNSAGAQATLASITSSFKNALLTYKNLNAVKVDTNNTALNDNGDKKKILQLNEDVQKRDDRIKELQNQLKSVGQNRNSNASPDTKKLEQENSFLSSSLRDVVFQNNKLIKSNTQQKQTIEKLNKQIEAFRRFTGGQ